MYGTIAVPSLTINNMTYENVMIDLETMGTNPNAAIVSIGAVAFDIKTRKIGEKFYSVIDLDSAIELGCATDQSTIDWWAKQSPEAQVAIKKDPKPIVEVLSSFAEFAGQLCDRSKLKVWGCGSDFDNVILNSAYQLAGIKTPWRFTNNRCYRTIRDLYPHIKVVRKGTYHNALHDAETQTMHLIDLLNPPLIPNKMAF